MCFMFQSFKEIQLLFFFLNQITLGVRTLIKESISIDCIKLFLYFQEGNIKIGHFFIHLQQMSNNSTKQMKNVTYLFMFHRFIYFLSIWLAKWLFLQVSFRGTPNFANSAFLNQWFYKALLVIFIQEKDKDVNFKCNTMM